MDAVPPPTPTPSPLPLPAAPPSGRLDLRQARRYALRYVMSGTLLLIFLLYVLQKIPIPVLDRLNLLGYDATLRLTMPGGVDPRVVIVDIDEKSLAEEGQWPWPRDRLATLLDRLFDQYHVGVVGFDVVFAEPDHSSGLAVLQHLATGDLKADRDFQALMPSLQEILDYDQRFAAALRDRPVVLGYYFGDQARTSGQLPVPALSDAVLKGRNLDTMVAVGYGANLPVLQAAARGAGHFTPHPDVDGINRRVPLLIEYKGHYYDSLALAMVRVIMDEGQGKPDVIPKFTQTGLEWLQVGALHIPVDGHGQALIPYRGNRGSFPYVSASDVLHGRVAPQVLARAAVLIGTTTPGLMDLRATPVGEIYPGVEIHANLLAGIFSNTIKEAPTYAMGADVLQTAVLGGIAVLLLPLLTALTATIATVVLLLIAVSWHLALWHWGNLALPLVPVFVLITLIYTLEMLLGYFLESRRKNKITHLFGQYIPRERVDEMARNPNLLSMEGRRCEMTVLFSDVRNFTTISEGLDPQSLSQLMNAYLTPMTKIIYDGKGTVDKYIGDAIMAFWGAPLEDEQHARRAVQAALAMQRQAEKTTEEFAVRGWPAIHIGVGINTGVMRVGDMGSEFRKAYTVMGDAVNLASRLEGLTKQYGVTIIVGEQTHALLPDFAFRELDRVTVKGKNKPVVIYEPLGYANDLSDALKEELKQYHRALKYYRAQDWEQAAVAFYRLNSKFPGMKLYTEYLKRVDALRNNPPGPEWDGVYHFTTK